MASRRMFSNKIIQSARFLKMPSSTQVLYFHLGLNADDDGIVEAYNTMKLVSSSEDDLKILVAKGFIKILNDDLVTFITDWREHNLIRADRKVDSVYRNLLLQVVDNVQLIESKPRADLVKKNTDAGNGRPEGSIGKDRLGKDRLGKVSLDEGNKPANAGFDYSGFSDLEIAAINDWLQYKKERKQSYKATGLKLLHKKLVELSSRGQLIQAVNHSITNNYVGLFEDKIVTQVTAKSAHDLSTQPKTKAEIEKSLGIEINLKDLPF